MLFYFINKSNEKCRYLLVFNLFTKQFLKLKKEKEIVSLPKVWSVASTLNYKNILNGQIIYILKIFQKVKLYK